MTPSTHLLPNRLSASSSLHCIALLTAASNLIIHVCNYKITDANNRGKVNMSFVNIYNSHQDWEMNKFLTYGWSRPVYCLLSCTFYRLTYTITANNHFNTRDSGKWTNKDAGQSQLTIICLLMQACDLCNKQSNVKYTERIKIDAWVHHAATGAANGRMLWTLRY